jgi:hypothetical protein
MRSAVIQPPLVCAVLAALIGGAGTGVRAAEDVARAEIVASAEVRARSGVRVSSDVLHFDVVDDGVPAVAAIAFAAGVRVAADADVRVLASVAADLGVTVTLLAIDGAIEVPVAGAGTTPVVVARWNGAGFRTGELRFALRGAPGRYAVPVQIEVSVR